MAAMAGIAAVLLPTLVFGQQPDDTESRTYALRNAQATALEATLSRVVPPGTTITSDVQFNRLVIRGTPQAHEVAAKAIQSLDRPAENIGPMGPGVASEPILRVYPCSPQDAPATANRLRSELAKYPGARVAADPRTGQLLVLAPPEVQVQIGRLLDQKPGIASGQIASHPATTRVVSPATIPAGQRVALQNTSTRQIEAALMATLGQRLVAQGVNSAGVASYRIRTAGNGTVDLSIDSSANVVYVSGSGIAAQAAARLVMALDAARSGADQQVQMVSLQASKAADVQKAATAIQSGSTAPAAAAVGTRPGTNLAMLLQKPEEGQPPAEANHQPVADAANAPNNQPSDMGGGLLGPVQIEMLEGLDVVIVRGRQRDVEQVMRIIQQIERLSVELQPAIETYALQHVDSESMGQLVTQLYIEVFAPRQGDVSITALAKPNALLLVGRPENVRTAIDLVKRLDQPVPPETQFRVFNLKHATAMAAQSIAQEFFANRGTLGTKARVTFDYRTNALVVQASPRDLAEVGELIDKLDTPTSESVNELRIFKLENSLAGELAPLLQDAISGQTMAGRTGVPGAAGIGTTGAVGGLGGQAGRMPTDQKSSMLRFLTVDPKGQRLLKSGILSDVRVTADVRANALVVSAPSDCMELIEALIRELDRMPAAEAQIKVFTIVNADATSLAQMLQGLFPQQTLMANQPAVQISSGEGESSLVPVRFAVDVRTNSIIASGSMGDLNIVEALLLRLDDSDIRHRRSTVYRLKNAPAQDVANAITNFLRSEQQLQQISPGLVSPFEQLEREVVVVPEIVSNSLIVGATPRFYDEIQSLVEQLDKRPPMVMIQVLIAEVDLNNFDEFGVELGLQDSILFDRSILGDILTTTSTNTATQTGMPTVTSTNQNVLAATNTPGYAFNNQPLGNSGSSQSLATSPGLGGQSLSSFGVNRTNGTLGYGGLVLSASSESVSVLIRALQQCRRLDVLSRPQVMTLDNQAAFVQVGQRVPRITSSTLATTGQQINNISLDNVGILLGVTPRISPDGLVVMQIDAEKSEVGPEAEGIPISIFPDGQVVRSPRINTTTAQTTVAAFNGQTVILGGLITRDKMKTQRRVPYLSNIPVIGQLFRYDSTDANRKELLIIMTPHIVTNEQDAHRLKQVETSRMSWCLADVEEVHGELGVRQRSDEWADGDTKVVYPDAAPMPPAPAALESVPTPEGTPAKPSPSDSPSGVKVEEKVPSLLPKQKPSAKGPTPDQSSQQWQADPVPGASPWPRTDASVTPAAFQQPIQP